ncbi:sugar phosphate isomerase [Paenibacillus baekrokdamisoli]|uniref:Sugar phosphate isomerase n=1 Tax=Paenibacillus baekrokdamisoli TaxID=1712516 RepID=A0A3G9JA32_9BACL|nr:sugar phosphate isomerase/epimerase [Paenibacillus baekrokdamisoli]MBB3072744.1 sugar phosphate isomerase/epimerase [Paenibacillus baekrokdamisoli]BBH20134.1 sugar phosphate isomerase [Paenibacillus baekrokdamisoli]
MKRLAFSTLPCEGWSLDEMIAIAKECGFSGIELREGDTWGISNKLTADERKAVLWKFQDACIAITNIGSNVCFTGKEGDVEQFDILQKAVVLAHDLKADGVRIFLGYFNMRRDNTVPAIPYAEIVNRIQQSCDYAVSYGVQIWIETHNEFATGRSLRKLLDDVDRPNCAVIYDIIHPLEEGETPAETIALLGSQCVHVHVKDGVPFDDPLELSWKYTRVGEGKVPIASIVEQLEQAGYSGSYSLEWETKWRKELQIPGMEPAVIFPLYVKWMRRLLQTYTN